MENNFEKVLLLLREGNDYFSSMELLTEEAATIANEDNFKFMVYPEPLGNPSFHVRYKDEWEVVLEMFSFKILESKFGPYKKGHILPKKITKRILSILTEKKQIGVLVWKYMLQVWNDNNPNYKIDVNKEILNFKGETNE